MPNVADALAAARRDGFHRLDAQLLLASVLERPRAWLLAHGDAPLDAAHEVALVTLLARRAAGEPLAYLLGAKEFHGLSLAVTPDVLVPRPDTETLVAWGLEVLDAKQGGADVLDLGTGSGAIALAIASACPRARVCASDVSEAALAVAQSNGAQLGIGVEWLHGDWWSALAGRRFDLVLANPPYVADADPHLPLLCHEPRIALCAGPQGLDALRAIVGAAPGHLTPGGWLLLEHGSEQGDAVTALLDRNGFGEIDQRRDLADHLRCTGGRSPLR